jgi:thioredoxin reductase (NADPH)
MESTDILIIGGGGVGLASSMYAARLGMKSIVFGFSHGSELSIGGVITTTNIVENYPGFIKVTGQEIAKKIEEHARSYSEVNIKEELVESISQKKDKFIVKTKNGSYQGKAVIFATGTKWKQLEVPGSNEFANKGVHYCALCDSMFYKNKVVAVVGGSDSAAKDALLLSEHAKKVYIIYRGEKIRAEPINLKRINESKNIEVINNTNILKINGENFVTNVELDQKYNGSKTLILNGVFVAIGHIVLSDLAKLVGVKVDEKNEIIINHIDSSTNVEGVFAAGDVNNKPFKQLITGVADGCTAAHSAYDYIRKKGL